MCRCECKTLIKFRAWKGNYGWNPSAWASEITKNIKIIADELVTTCDEIIYVFNTVSINLSDKKATCEIDNYYISLSFKLVTILLLTIVIICYCFIKPRVK